MVKPEKYAEPRIVQNDFFMDIAREINTDYSNLLKYGRNPSIGIDEEVIWDQGGDYPFLTSEKLLSVVSTDASDAVAGGGVQVVTIQGLDKDYFEIEEKIPMDGLTPVLSTKKFLRVHRAFAFCGEQLSPVTDPANAGDITITAVEDEVVLAKILTGVGQTLMAVYTVPADKSAYLISIMASTGQGKQAVFKLKTRDNSPFTEPCVFRTKIILDLYQNAFSAPIMTKQRIAPRTDIVITGQVDSTPAIQISTFFELILIKD